MKLTMYQIDAFASEVFSGNPAAVCVLEEWLPDEKMQQIAMENNLSETAFAVPMDKKFEIRWFTPKAEVALCGHATLACSHVLFMEYKLDTNKICFLTRKRGELFVEQDNDWLILDFPTDDFDSMPVDPVLNEIFGTEIKEQYKGTTDLMLVLEDEQAVRSLKPDFSRLKNLAYRGFILTAAGEQCDFVSRFFCPTLGIDEDPVTGSAHTSLTPYWAEKLGKNQMEARQLSERGGFLKVEYKNDRVLISGQAVKYMEGIVFV